MIDQKIMNIVRDVEQYTARTLKQQYVKLNGNWWLITLGWPIRRLTPHEVAYHVERRHAPFVAGGVKRDDLRW